MLHSIEEIRAWRGEFARMCAQACDVAQPSDPGAVLMLALFDQPHGEAWALSRIVEVCGGIEDDVDVDDDSLAIAAWVRPGATVAGPLDWLALQDRILGRRPKLRLLDSMLVGDGGQWVSMIDSAGLHESTWCSGCNRRFLFHTDDLDASKAREALMWDMLEIEHGKGCTWVAQARAKALGGTPTAQSNGEATTAPESKRKGRRANAVA